MSNVSLSCNNHHFENMLLDAILSSGCFLHFPGKPMRIYLELIGSRSKDIGYSLTLEAISWIIQHLKHHFALNKEIHKQFSRITSISHKFIYQPFLEDNLGMWLKLLGKPMRVPCYCIMQVFVFSMLNHAFMFYFLYFSCFYIFIFEQRRCPSPPSLWILSGTHHLKLCMARHSHINSTILLLCTHNKKLIKSSHIYCELWIARH